MPSFGSLQSAMTGLNAARAGITVSGQNVTNASTPGYTRQRVDLGSLGPAAKMGSLGVAGGTGLGATVNGYTRLGDEFLDAQARRAGAANASGFVLANTFSAVEGITGEPTALGVSSLSQEFWSSWQDIGNQPGESAPVSVMLEKARTLADKLNGGLGALEAQWAQDRSTLGHEVDEINTLAGQLAQMNTVMRTTAAEGGSINEMMDSRSLITSRLAELTGGSSSINADGTSDFKIGGIGLVVGGTARSITLTGSTAPGATPSVEWSHHPGQKVGATDGSLAGHLHVLSPAGPVSSAHDAYKGFMQSLADQVNAMHGTGVTPGGGAGAEFFQVDVLGRLSVVPTDKSTVATGAATGGTLDGSIADKMSQLGKVNLDETWSKFVGQLGAQSQSALKAFTITTAAHESAVGRQESQASVDLDEENINLLAYQRQFQAVARLTTIIDEMLDQVINRLGK
jgi:flagellar hook-associated protein 1 FlgK